MRSCRYPVNKPVGYSPVMVVRLGESRSAPVSVTMEDLRPA